jgi:hypothetical protein
VITEGELNMSWKRIAFAATLTFGLNGATYAAGGLTPPAVPTDIEVPSGHKLILVGHAVGTQNYICAPATSAGVEWFFLGPQATVFDAAGRQIATHFLSKNPFRGDALQATWQHSGDTSAVWATKLRGSTDPAYVAPDAIEWLRLEMTGAQVGPLGGDKLATTKIIQRVHTVGGLKPPAAECTASTINTRKFVSYEADYYFYE